MEVKKEGENLIITLPIDLRPAASGKFRVATSGGVQRTSIEIEGHPVHVSANAFIYKESPRVQWKLLLPGYCEKEEPKPPSLRTARSRGSASNDRDKQGPAKKKEEK